MSSGRSSAPSPTMSHSIPRRMRKGASSSLAVGDLLRLPAQIVAVEARHDTHGTGVVANRQVLVPERPRRLGHLADGRSTVGCIRVAVEVAADPVEREEVVGHGGRRQLSQLRWDVRQPEQTEDAGLVGCVGERAERRHVLWRSGGLDERCSDALRRSSVQLDGKAVGRHAEIGLEDGDDVGVRGEPRPRLGGVLARHDDRESFRGVLVAPSVARRDPAEPLGDSRGECERLVESHRSRRRRPPPVEGGADRRLGSRPDARNLPQPPGRGRLAQLVGRLDPQGGADLRAPAGAESEQAAESGELGRGLPAKLLHLGEAPGLDELA